MKKAFIILLSICTVFESIAPVYADVIIQENDSAILAEEMAAEGQEETVIGGEIITEADTEPYEAELTCWGVRLEPYWKMTDVILVCNACGTVLSSEKDEDGIRPTAEALAHLEICQSGYHQEPVYEYVEGTTIEDHSSVNLSRKSFTYTGSAIKPIKYLTVKGFGGDEAEYENGYTVTFKNNIKPGKATMIIEGECENLGMRKVVNFTIKPADISKTVSVEIKYPKLYYTGKKRTQTNTTVVTRKIGKRTKILKRNKDYKITYKNNTKIGTATMIITGIGGYTGTIKKTFRIVRKTK